MKIFIRSVFNNKNEYHSQVFSEECYEYKKCFNFAIMNVNLKKINLKMKR